jgi:hypothetical protein
MEQMMEVHPAGWTLAHLWVVTAILSVVVLVPWSNRIFRFRPFLLTRLDL